MSPCVRKSIATSLLGQTHTPQHAEIVNMRALPGSGMDKPVRLDGQRKGFVHIMPEVLEISATRGVQAERLEDGIHAQLDMVGGHQVAVALEEQDIEIPWKARSWHAFRRAYGTIRTVLIIDMQHCDCRPFA